MGREFYNVLIRHGPLQIGQAPLFEINFLEKREDILIVLIPVFLFLGLAIPFIGNGYWDDELFSVTTAQSWPQMVSVFREYETNMALYIVILHGWIHFFGAGEVATHALSVLFALLAQLAFYRLERIWFNKTTALLGALLLAANPTFIYYSVESRSYALLALLGIWSTFLFIRLLMKPGIQLACLYGLSIVGATYTHYFGILLLLAHGLSFPKNLFNRDNLRIFSLSGILILAGLLPLAVFPPQYLNKISWMPRTRLSDLSNALQDLFGGKKIMVLLTACLLVIVWKGFWKYLIRGWNFLAKLSLTWSIVPVLLLFVVSYFFKPLFITRYFIWCVPGSVLLVMLILGYSGKSLLLKNALWCLVFLFLLIQIYGRLHFKGSGYRDAVKFLIEQAQPGEAVIAYPAYKSDYTKFYMEFTHPPPLVNKPFVLTSLPYMVSGAGRENDPDMDILENISQRYRKIYIITTPESSLGRVDTILNMSSLKQIEKKLDLRHGRLAERVFGEKTAEPVSVITYQ